MLLIFIIKTNFQDNINYYGNKGRIFRRSFPST